MKKLLVLPLVLLSFCAIAEERIILGSYERESSEHNYEIVRVGIESNFTLDGVGAKLFNFKDNGLYLGVGFAYLFGDREFCVWSTCSFYDANETLLSGEIGRALGQWTPFVGTSFTRTEIKYPHDNNVEETWSVNAGMWFEFNTFKLRGAVTDLEDEENRSIFGGLMFEVDNTYIVGAEIEVLLDNDKDRYSFSFQIGRSF